MSQQSTDLTEKPIMIISGHEHIIRGIAYIPGGERIVTCSYDRSIRIWNVEKGDQEGTSMMHEGYVHGLAVTRDGKRILSCGDKKVGVWDVETHEQIEEWASHTSNISCIALSPDDQFVANGDEGGQVMIWKVESGEITRVIYAGTGRVNSLCFSPNGEKLACAVDNVDMIYLVQIYDLESGEIVLGPIQGHENTVRCVLWSLDGSQLFSASDDHTIRCWDPESVDSIGPPWTGHTDAVLSLSLSPDGTTLASASYDKTVRFWDARFGGLIGPPLQHEAWLYAVTFSPCGEFIASGARDRRLYIYGVPWRGESQEQANHSLLESAWNLNEIHSTVAHCDLTGYVVRDGDHPLASGSFGDVYRGKLHVGGRPVDVAVKAIKTYAADDGDYSKKNKRLRRELTTWANLNHVNILPLYGTTMSFGRFPAMVCPWLENGSLTSYLECRHDTLKVVERLVLISDIAAGLQYLHFQSIAHGDLSGSNVLIDDNGRACISDFGLSTLLTKLGGSTYATSRHVEGTLRWTAPELLDLQVSEDEENPLHVNPTPRSDVFSFGRIMLQILTGKVPYHYYIRDAQVLYAISKDIIPRRPSQGLVTDRQWTFMQRCWTTVDAGELRPCDDEIVEFARQELVGIGQGTL